MKAGTAMERALAAVFCLFLMITSADAQDAKQFGVGVTVQPNGVLPLRDAAPASFFGVKATQIGTTDPNKQYVVISKKLVRYYRGEQVWLQIVPREALNDPQKAKLDTGWVYAGGANKVVNFTVVGSQE